MTRAEIIAIQTELGVQADGIWGPITAAAYAARMAHEAPGAPVALPPVSKPWWTSRAVLGLLASVLAMIAGRFGWSIDDGQITDLLLRSNGNTRPRSAAAGRPLQLLPLPTTSTMRRLTGCLIWR